MSKHTAVGIADRLEQARVVAATLSIATDELNARLSEAEKQFAALKLGVSEDIELAEVGDADDLVHARLCFQKEGSAWRFVIREGTDFGGRRSETRLLQAPRHVRIRSASYLEPLLEKLIRKAEAQNAMVGQAVQRVAELNLQLSQGGAAPSAGVDDDDTSS